MINKNDIDLASLFKEIDEPSQNDNFTKKVFRRINNVRRTRFIIKISLAFLGLFILMGTSPWLMKQTDIALVMADSLVRGITVVCLSPVGWVLSSIVVLYPLLKTR
jgi:hypothetical protein